MGIESRGFLLGGATAVALGVGFVAIRKAGTGLLPVPKVKTTAQEDYQRRRHQLRMQSALQGSTACFLSTIGRSGAVRRQPPETSWRCAERSGSGPNPSAQQDHLGVADPLLKRRG